MRIRKLTSQLEKHLLSRRAQSDAEAQRVASEIVSDVRRRGDAALLTWTNKLDHAELRPKDLWFSQKEIRAAECNVSPDFLGAIRHAA
ncbi:MAG: histidinol dehydrogenase, partial [Acidobacteria bacterium]